MPATSSTSALSRDAVAGIAAAAVPMTQAMAFGIALHEPHIGSAGAGALAGIGDETRIKTFTSSDAALEYAEDRLLEEHGALMVGNSAVRGLTTLLSIQPMEYSEIMISKIPGPVLTCLGSAPVRLRDHGAFMPRTA